MAKQKKPKKEKPKKEKPRKEPREKRLWQDVVASILTAFLVLDGLFIFVLGSFLGWEHYLSGNSTADVVETVSATPRPNRTSNVDVPSLYASTVPGKGTGDRGPVNMSTPADTDGGASGGDGAGQDGNAAEQDSSAAAPDTVSRDLANTPSPAPTQQPEPAPEPKPSEKVTMIRGVPSTTTVYVSNRSDTIHRINNCSGLKYYREMSLGRAESNGYEYCKNCWQG